MAITTLYAGHLEHLPGTPLLERRAHALNSEVFPLPGGAETTITRLVTAHRSSLAV
jgi:hypothetical protein